MLYPFEKKVFHCRGETHTSNIMCESNRVIAWEEKNSESDKFFGSTFGKNTRSMHGLHIYLVPLLLLLQCSIHSIILLWTRFLCALHTIISSFSFITEPSSLSLPLPLCIVLPLFVVVCWHCFFSLAFLILSCTFIIFRSILPFSRVSFLSIYAVSCSLNLYYYIYILYVHNFYSKLAFVFIGFSVLLFYNIYLFNVCVWLSIGVYEKYVVVFCAW